MNILILDIFCQQSGVYVEVAGCLLDTYISIVYIMATIGGCISVGDYIEIGYMLPTIRGVCTSCYVSVGPSRKPVLWGGFSLRLSSSFFCWLSALLAHVLIGHTIGLRQL